MEGKQIDSLILFSILSSKRNGRKPYPVSDHAGILIITLEPKASSSSHLLQTVP